MKTLRNIYFSIFDSHLSYSCFIWAQNIRTVEESTSNNEFQKRLFHSSPLFSANNILKYGDKITLENILFVSKFINWQVFSIFNDSFTFSGNLHKYDCCWSVTNYLTITTFQIQNYNHFSIRASAIRS